MFWRPTPREFAAHFFPILASEVMILGKAILVRFALPLAIVLFPLGAVLIAIYDRSYQDVTGASCAHFSTGHRNLDVCYEGER